MCRGMKNDANQIIICNCENEEKVLQPKMDDGDRMMVALNWMGCGNRGLRGNPGKASTEYGEKLVGWRMRI